MRPSILFLIVLLISGPRSFAGPEIFSLDPEWGPAGTRIALKGKGLTTTTHVGFAVGRTVKPARFKVVSDRELEVIAPEYYRAQAAATVAVFTRNGATVAMPATTQEIRTSVRGNNPNEPGAGFYHVLDGGLVTYAGSVALIEGGGTVERAIAGMQFVKRGGTLVGVDNANGIVFYEQGAIFGPRFARSSIPLTFIRVASISGSPGVGPFVYEHVLNADPGHAPAVPPQIRSIEPRAAAAGDIITVHGRGFARTFLVQCIEKYSGPRQVGFRVISDDTLKVEVPDNVLRPGPQLLIVQSTEGLTVTVPQDSTIRPAMLRHGSNPDGFYWIGPGDIADRMGGASAVFVEGDGLLDRMGGGRIVFVKRGGRVADSGSAPAAFYYEPGAVVPEHLKGRRNAAEVPHIVPSFLPSAFEVLPGPVFRH